MFKKTIFLLSCMCLVSNANSFADFSMFDDVDDIVRRMENSMSGSHDDFNIDATLDAVQARIDKMRGQFDHMEKQMTEYATKSSQSAFTIKDEGETIYVSVSIGEAETDMIENHLEKNTLVVTLPKDKPTLRIAIHPEAVVVTGNVVIEKEQKTDDDNKAASHIIASRNVHYEQTLPAAVVTTENVNIIHDAEEKKLTIELPKKTHPQQFTIQRK